MPKTGTSTFQRFLNENAQALSESGLAPLRAGMARDGAHHLLIHILSGRGTAHERKRMEAAVSAELTERRGLDVIISSESLASVGLSNGENVLLNLKKIAEQKRFGVVVLLSVRNPAEFIVSAYSQQAKTFSAFEDFTAVAHGYARRRDYFALNITPIINAGIPSIFIPFDLRAKKIGIDALLLQAMGRKIGNFQRVERENESAGACRVAAALALTEKLFGERETNTAVAALLGSIVERAANRVIPDDPVYHPMGPDTARLLREAYKKECNRFATSIWGCSWSSVFAGRDVSKSPTTVEAAANREQLVEATREIVKRSLPEIMMVLNDAPLIKKLSRYATTLVARTALRGFASIIHEDDWRRWLS